MKLTFGTLVKRWHLTSNDVLNAAMSRSSSCKS